METNNPRKFKDRIALLNQKQEEGTAQFQAVMREVKDVWKPSDVSQQYQQCHNQTLGEDRTVPRHLSPCLPNYPNFTRCGGSLPNVNQMAAASAQNQKSPQNRGLPQLHEDQGSYLSGSCGHISKIDQRVSGQTCSGGGAIRNRSGDNRRWETSPYRGERCSNSLSPYQSPTRRTSSDSALYQSASGQEHVKNCFHNIPTIKQEMYPVKQELPSVETINCKQEMVAEPSSIPCSSPSSQCCCSSPSVCIPSSAPSSPTIPATENHLFQQTSSNSSFDQYQHNNFNTGHISEHDLEQGFLNFKLENHYFENGPSEDIGQQFGQISMSAPQQACRASAHNLSGIPEFTITDFSQFQDGLQSDLLVDQLRQQLEPIDDQMLQLLSGTGMLEQLEQVEQQLKLN